MGIFLKLFVAIMAHIIRENGDKKIKLLFIYFIQRSWICFCLLFKWPDFKMFGKASNACNSVVEARCGSNGQCPLANLLYHFNDHLEVPCAAAMSRGIITVNADDQVYCLLCMTTRNETCYACCRDPSCHDLETCPR